MQSSTCKRFHWEQALAKKGSLFSFHLLPQAPLRLIGSCPTPNTNAMQSTKYTSRHPMKGQPPEPVQAFPWIHQQGQGLTRTIKWSASCSFTGVKGCPLELCSDGLHESSCPRSSGAHPGLHQPSSPQRNSTEGTRPPDELPSPTRGWRRIVSPSRALPSAFVFHSSVLGSAKAPEVTGHLFSSTHRNLPATATLTAIHHAVTR